MSVYIDNVFIPWHGFVMCHMTADSETELHAFAKKLGLKRSWHQVKQENQNCYHSHYDVCLSKRKKAVKLGAIEIDARDKIRVIIRMGRANDLVLGGL